MLHFKRWADNKRSPPECRPPPAFDTYRDILLPIVRVDVGVHVMVWPPFVLIICWALLVPSAFGLSVNFHGPRGVIQRSTQQLVSRGPAGGLALNNSGDVGYYAGIVLGNQTYQVLLDTGR